MTSFSFVRSHTFRRHKLGQEVVVTIPDKRQGPMPLVTSQWEWNHKGDSDC